MFLGTLTPATQLTSRGRTWEHRTMGGRNRARENASAALGGAVVLATAALACVGTVPSARALTTAPSSSAAATPRQPGECCWATGANVAKVGGDYGDQDY